MFTFKVEDRFRTLRLSLLTGIVKAEMKDVTYSLKMILAESGDILNAHCECGAGRGPSSTCKHVVAIGIMLVNFIKTGELKVKLTCTEQLQTFKRPSTINKSSPLEAEKLGKGKGSKFFGEGSLDYDPRPEKFRNDPTFMDRVRNATVNFCAESNLDITLRYAFPRASLKGPALDHHYEKEPMTHY